MYEKKLPKSREEHWKEVVTTISEAHTGLGVVCILKIQSGNTDVYNTQSIRQNPAKSTILAVELN